MWLLFVGIDFFLSVWMGFTLHRLFVLSGLWSAFKIIFHKSLSKLSIFSFALILVLFSGLFYINIVGGASGDLEYFHIIIIIHHSCF